MNRADTDQGPALGELLAAHPALRLRLLVDDSPIDLINARIDLAVRYGRLQDSTWAARRLGGMQWYLCAAPGWVAAHGVPQHPDALLSHSWLGFARENGGLLIDLRSPTGDPRALRVEPRIASNNQLSIQQMCEAGLGLALLGSMDSQDALQAGRLGAAVARQVVWHPGHLGHDAPARRLARQGAPDHCRAAPLSEPAAWRHGMRGEQSVGDCLRRLPSQGNRCHFLSIIFLSFRPTNSIVVQAAPAAYSPPPKGLLLLQTLMSSK